MYKKLFSLAIPNIISNITIPLVGMADLVIVGMLHSDNYLAGMAIGTAIFNMLYWNFGFLRMGTSGLAAQSYGRRDFKDSGRILLRALSVAFAISAIILAFQAPIIDFSLWFMDGSEVAESAAYSYFKIRIWAAPATLALYVFNGWFVGMQNSRTPMWVAITINVINVAASYFFAITLNGDLEGVAYGTLLAQWSGVLLALYFVLRYYHRVLRGGIFGTKNFMKIFSSEKLMEFFKLNRDIFIRTFCSVAVFTYFTKASSSMGDAVLSANTLLMQLFTLFSYFMDGFAYAGESLSGRYYGSGSRVLLNKSIRTIFDVGLITALLFSAFYLFLGGSIMSIFTDSEAVLSAANDYIVFAAAIPIMGYSAFLWDGVLVGMTLSKLLRNSMLGATAIFFTLYFSLNSLVGNNSLWIAFLAFLLTRGILQWLFTRKILGSEATFKRFAREKLKVDLEKLRGDLERIKKEAKGNFERNIERLKLDDKINNLKSKLKK